MGDKTIHWFIVDYIIDIGNGVLRNFRMDLNKINIG